MWKTIAELADELGCSRRAVERALDGDGVVEGERGPVTVEQRPAEENDFATLGITRRTTRLVRIAGETAEEVVRRMEYQAAEVLDGRGSPEATLEWFERIRTGEEHCVTYTSKGDRKEDEFPGAARVTAAVQAQKIREYLDERERNFLPKADVSNAFAAMGSLFRDRMQSIPSRLADTIAGAPLTEARARLKTAIDDVLLEVAAAGERELASLLEGVPDE